MATSEIKVTKQSLNDYQVTVRGMHVAWISKGRTGGWVVNVKDVGELPYLRFKEAKAYAMQQAQIEAAN